jgi:hypothetical protein
MRSGAPIIAERAGLFFLLGAAAFVFLGVFQAHAAGLGITPPYVKNDSLTRTSSYEQKIILVRQDPVDDLEAQITVNVPGADKWFSVDKGMTFTLPKNETQVPIMVRVQVPKDASFDNYKGTMTIRISSAQAAHAPGVSVAIGAQVDVDLTVIDKKIFDFKVRTVRVADLEEGYRVLWWYFPGHIQFTMQIENTGNIDAVPTRVHFDTYDVTGSKLLESIDALSGMKKTPPFGSGPVVADFATKLTAGSYKVHYTIFKGDVVNSEGTMVMSVLPRGAIGGPGMPWFGGLSWFDRITLILVIIVPLFLLIFFIVRLRRHHRHRA